MEGASTALADADMVDSSYDEDPRCKAGLVNLVVGADRNQADHFSPFNLDLLEDDPDVMSYRARPGASEIPAQLVRMQSWLKRVFTERANGCLKSIPKLRTPLEQVLRGSTKRSGPEDITVHEVSSRIKSSAEPFV
jgi:hypothetical protein